LLAHIVVYSFFFFFSSRRRHTRSKRDWSSDVCSSDLPLESAVAFGLCHALAGTSTGEVGLELCEGRHHVEKHAPHRVTRVIGHRSEERRVGKECRSRWSTYNYRKRGINEKSDDVQEYR